MQDTGNFNKYKSIKSFAKGAVGYSVLYGGTSPLRNAKRRAYYGNILPCFALRTLGFHTPLIAGLKAHSNMLLGEKRNSFSLTANYFLFSKKKGAAPQ